MVALVGVTLYRAIEPLIAADADRPRGSRRPGRSISGPSPTTIHGAKVFVLPNPSGRNANFSYAENAGAPSRSVLASSPDQCAPAAARPLGRRISMTSGRSSKKIIPSSRKTSTNATIVACRCTVPNTAAYAR